MGQIIFIIWRESVEALLVVGILYAWLANNNNAIQTANDIKSNKKGMMYLWAGVAFGLLAALLIGAALLAATAIAREGSETVIFLYGLGIGQPGALTSQLFAAIGIGFILPFATFYILQ
ncbi:hypothetical protein ACTFIZ_002352 [Dictyostelium cf. discoideum]